MPITKSAKKAIKQATRRRIKNIARKDAVREVVGKIKKLVALNKQSEALALLPQAYKALDKAAKTNVIHKNAASRKKSRLTKLIKKSGKS
ncbi:MAG: 30S ribosomal protein S20 [Candidatus Niyogibacteria bacterium RIFCSPHIGHO2_01_FULL_45_28]|uniref:Small ribosomal subunit protein bS20 n=1 Tax=Candidatus Wildermuthbacteria bacterium RIFCSPHIGHO2_02_FULL_47_17 TaxID=1802452 RepID=A0A1G2R713_9BACT|nr:MAG: 30S ribosomal protein S20 [Candidatus Niyogibacteria bacterium RIFCSPHIGHO2_01_FULL_45_28]OHA68616.1 MAG: 30S ribosomal protein S20 [Candidatus Wildermuthbacteria bacterium RIFCSPHIGHO2_02_FULL_47_17]OHA75897.1 MAG: 30S ribosomal protein S20 [Candidatus Wildermuthbacteria bacterium RIFCSPLOWO2_02_FULL_47_10]